MATRPIDLSVVIPVYNSEATLPSLVDRLRTVLDRKGISWEVVFIDDGSRDHSWDVLRQLQEAHRDHVTAIQLMRNYGQHNALMCGFRHTHGELIATMDDDLQNPPEELVKLIEGISRGNHDLVFGVEKANKHDRWRNLGSSIARLFFQKVFRTNVSPTSFRIFRRRLLESILSYNLNYTYIDGLLAWNTQRIGTVEVEHHARKDGRSGYSMGKLLLHALNLFTSFSLLPLQVVSVCGFLAAVVGLAMSLYYLAGLLLKHITVPGFASVIIAILMLGGAQLLALGIMGEYLGRLHLNVNRKPQYAERSVLRASGDLDDDQNP